MNNRRTGMDYETKACEYLCKNGYEILERNFANRMGEIDIIGKESGNLCFIEVKYRKNKDSGYAAEAVTKKKQQTIMKVAGYYLTKMKYATNQPCRFDVVAIDDNKVTLIKNAFGSM